MNKLDIIIPVHNESEIIVNLLLQFEKQINCNYKVIICYDFDDDSTPKVINQSFLDKSKIQIIKNKSVGPNEAIKTGIDYSNAEIILVYMADDFLNISLIDKMILKIDEGYDLIIPRIERVFKEEKIFFYFSEKMREENFKSDLFSFLEIDYLLPKNKVLGNPSDIPISSNEIPKIHLEEVFEIFKPVYYCTVRYILII